MRPAMPLFGRLQLGFVPRCATTKPWRVGGDEFVILQLLDKGKRLESTLRQRIVESLARPMRLSGGNVVNVGASIGTACYPDDGENHKEGSRPIYETHGKGVLAMAFTASGMNIVLVHGAWSDGTGWIKVIPILQAAGHNVIAVQNQMSSLSDDAANTRGVIDSLPGPAVVVGHSYGGAVITSACNGARNVKALVYIAAFAPDEGEAVGALPPGPGVKYVAPGPNGLLYVDRAKFPQCFAGDLPEAEAAVLAAVQRPVAPAIFGEKMGAPAWKSIRTWYQVSENDEMIPPDLERKFASRAKATTISLASSHASLVSHPKEVSELILAAANS
jgi:pimeloyl-ACP methyl ester carboxylesterase